jgi:glycosyl transferase family 25
MKTLVINLKDSVHRKAYVEQLLYPYKFLEVEFIEAVNGKTMSDEELRKAFDQKLAYKKYGRTLRPGEVGCTLSHRKCASKIVLDGLPYALVLEDDITISRALEDIFPQIEEMMRTDKPLVILLSGDYWYYGKKIKVSPSSSITNIYQAVCSQAYLMNKAAAECLFRLPLGHLADDWVYIKEGGISVKAVYPHVFDQNRKDFPTEISTAYEGFIRKNLSWSARISCYGRAVIKRSLGLIGNFESKDMDAFGL